MRKKKQTDDASQGVGSPNSGSYFTSVGGDAVLGGEIVGIGASITIGAGRYPAISPGG